VAEITLGLSKGACPPWQMAKTTLLYQYAVDDVTQSEQTCNGRSERSCFACPESHCVAMVYRGEASRWQKVHRGTFPELTQNYPCRSKGFPDPYRSPRLPTKKTPCPPSQRGKAGCL